jgi:hypothetical protein
VRVHGRRTASDESCYWMGTSCPLVNANPLAAAGVRLPVCMDPTGQAACVDVGRPTGAGDDAAATVAGDSSGRSNRLNPTGV